MTRAAGHTDDIELLDDDREPITVDQLRQMMGWTFGRDGEQLAELWAAFNDRLWGGSLEPVPIWLPRVTTYGRWIGLYSGNHDHRSLSVQVKWQLSPQAQADVLLHECVHQALWEQRQCPAHNAWPWCREIVRLTRELWGIDIWAAPSVPRRVAGHSTRVQAAGPGEQVSITRQQIATWPHSLGLHVQVDQLLGAVAGGAA